MAHSANRVLLSVKEPRLKAFCLRLADQGLDDDQWIESMGSFLCSKPPSKWIDNDLSQFEDELHRCARQFFRVESILFDQPSDVAGAHAMRVAITLQDGSEVEQVVYLDASEEANAAKLEDSIRSLIAGSGRVGLAAATRAIRAQLESGNQQES